MKKLIERHKEKGKDEIFEEVNKMFDMAMIDEETRLKIFDEGYMDAPASKSHHLAVPGGLAIHSLNVTKWMVKLTDAGFTCWWQSESPYRIGMLHDLVKCRCYKIDQICQKETLCELYEKPEYVYQETGYVGHGVASALMAMSDFGINLTPVECACIVHHMGAFNLDGKALREYDAALDRWPSQIIATHTADIMAARFDEHGKF